jgi:hypothetical protein
MPVSGSKISYLFFVSQDKIVLVHLHSPLAVKIALKHDGEIFCVVSPDGSGRDAQNSKPLYAIEIKYPIPGKSFTTPVHYEVPSYYIPRRLLMWMGTPPRNSIFVFLNFDIASRRTLTVADIFIGALDSLCFIMNTVVLSVRKIIYDSCPL